MNVLVTGHKGFIGTNLLKVLEYSGDEFETVGLDQNTDDPPGQNICSNSDLRMALTVSGAKSIVHLAAMASVVESIEKPQHCFWNNVDGTFGLLEMARAYNVKRVVFASSAAAQNVQSPYGATKAAGEALCKAYYHSYGVETVILRFANVYGPHSAHKPSVITRFIKNALNGEPVTVYGDGEQTRDFIYVADLCNAISNALTLPYDQIGPEPIEICTGDVTTVNELLGMLSSIHCDIYGNKRLTISKYPERAGEIKHVTPNPKTARERLNFDAQTSIGSGLKETYDWFLDEKEAGGPIAKQEATHQSTECAQTHSADAI